MPGRVNSNQASDYTSVAPTEPSGNNNMVQRSLVTFLAAFGGILVILGGILAFVLSIGPYGYGPRFGAADFAILAALAIVFGIVILVYSGVTHFRGAEQNVTGGIVLIVLGIVTWVVAGAWLLVAVGSFLTVLAGAVLLLWILMDEAGVHVTQTS
ncbi:MAG: hypothetical protein WBF81_04730 [Thermoplasmata archaeon]